MEDNKELVEETENTELTAEEIKDVESTEETPEETTIEPQEKTFTKDEVDSMIAKKLARKEAKMRKEYAEKYGKLETVVNAGLQTDNIDDAVTKLTDFYTKRGISIPTEPHYSERDLEVLANAEAEDIISGGYEDIVDETERLAKLDRLSDRDKLVLKRLQDERKTIEETKELASIGVKIEDLETPEFKMYASKLNPSLSLKEKYEMYLDKQPKKEIKTIGSMRGVPESKIKDYYTPEEISRLTEEDLDNPQIWEAVRRSMTGRA